MKFARRKAKKNYSVKWLECIPHYYVLDEEFQGFPAQWREVVLGTRVQDDRECVFGLPRNPSPHLVLGSLVVILVLVFGIAVDNFAFHEVGDALFFDCWEVGTPDQETEFEVF